MDHSYPSLKQQILCYILRTTLLYRQHPPCPIKEYPPCLKEHTEHPQCEALYQQDKTQDQLPHMDPLPQVMQVFATMEMDHTETPVPGFRRNSEVSISMPKPCEEQDQEPKFRRNSETQVLGFQRNSEKESELKVENVEMCDPIPEIFREEESGEKEKTNILDVISSPTDMSETKVVAEDILPIAPNVFSTSEAKYLIRIDKEEFAYADDEKSALSIINSLAIAEIKKLANTTTKVFRQDLHDGKEVRICTQALGYLVNGRITKNTVIDLVCIPKVVFSQSN